MIVSVHIPKTAGTTLQVDLRHVFGGRLLYDYDDWVEVEMTPETIRHNEHRRAEVLANAKAIAEQYDAVHGHFVANKYLGIFPVTALFTIVRDPYQHAVSTFEFASRIPDSTHPGFLSFKEQRMTLLDFIEAFPNHQSRYFGGLSPDDFTLIGLTERYEQSVALIEAICGIPMPRASVRQNVNPAKQSPAYEIDPDVRRAVNRFRQEDIELYRVACERFATLCSRYGV